MTPLTQEMLKHVGCSDPDCKSNHSNESDNSILFIHSQCHVNRHIEAYYDKFHGYLNIRCSKCRTMVAVFKIAER